MTVDDKKRGLKESQIYIKSKLFYECAKKVAKRKEKRKRQKHAIANKSFFF
jgi:hypothetical protein